MKQSISIIVFLLSVVIIYLFKIPYTYALEEHIKNMFENRVGLLANSNSCVSKNYLRAIVGKSKNYDNCPLDELEGAEIYYSFQSELLKTYIDNDYISSARVIEKYTNLERFNNYISDTNYLKMLKNKAEMYDLTQLIEKAKLEIEYDREQGAFIEPSTKFKIDTGIKFGLFEERYCTKTKFKKEVIGALGDLNMYEGCLVQLEKNETFPSLISLRDQNIFGTHYLLSYSEVTNISNLAQHAASTTLDLFYDGHWMFFSGSIVFSNNTLTEQNICLDSGAVSSYLSPRFYRNVRDSLIDEKVIKLTSDNDSGTDSALGKIVGSLIVVVGGKEIKLIDTPALFRHPNLSQCDLVIGQDVMKKMKRIDTKNRTITFSI
ncbi:hypothetical protein ACD631_21090 (plasmid) [Alteromonas macleodii]|uniref:hypothetical protein n=1 Tax=Alteromonas macleodii TaxID=28108 RepID=UPI002076829C|nr:hypothetical protein [Alteromonas macleodii]USI30268.1 hypothetical protein NFG60_20940 [Alteromonas macleodii]